MTTDYGVDYSTFLADGTVDLDPSFKVISGQNSVRQGILRRFMTPAGSLPDDRNAGYDILNHLNKQLRQTDLYQIKVAMEREALKDERVYSCLVKVEWSPRESKLTCSFSIDTMFGTFAFVLTSDQLTVEALKP
jgi:hypothetical protein